MYWSVLLNFYISYLLCQSRCNRKDNCTENRSNQCHDDCLQEHRCISIFDLNLCQACRNQVLAEWRAQKNLLQKQEQMQESEEMTEEEKAQEKKVLWARILAGIALAAVVVFYLVQR